MRTLKSAMLVLWLLILAPASFGQARTSYRPMLPDMDDIAPLADMTNQPSAEELQARAEVREYRRQIRAIRHRYLGSRKNADLRAEGLEQLGEFTDPASFVPLIEELQEEQDDVRLALLNHFEDQGDWGQAALGWIVLQERKDEAFHYEALQRLSTPVGDPLMNLIDQGLRSRDDFVANMAGRLAGHLNLHNTIPLLIHGQSRTDRVREPGDDAWILIGQQKAFIRALIPIIGDGSGAFMPVPGVLTEGVILRVVEAVAVIYRTEVHRTLVAMTSQDWGQPTDDLGYDPQRWRAWYENEYLPYKEEQARMQAMMEQDPLADREADDHASGDRGSGDSD